MVLQPSWQQEQSTINNQQSAKTKCHLLPTSDHTKSNHALEAPLPSTHDVLQSEFVTSRLPLEPHSRSTQQSTSLHRPTSPPVNGQLCVTTKTCPLLQTLLFQPCSFSCHSSVTAGAIVQLTTASSPTSRLLFAPSFLTCHQHTNQHAMNDQGHLLLQHHLLPTIFCLTATHSLLGH